MKTFITELQQAGIPVPAEGVNYSEHAATLPDNGQRGRFLELLSAHTTVISSPEEDAIRASIKQDLETAKTPQDIAKLFEGGRDVTYLPDSQEA